MAISGSRHAVLPLMRANGWQIGSNLVNNSDKLQRIEDQCADTLCAACYEAHRYSEEIGLAKTASAALAHAALAVRAE